jgi:hypothetical protein
MFWVSMMIIPKGLYNQIYGADREAGVFFCQMIFSVWESAWRSGSVDKPGAPNKCGSVRRPFSYRVYKTGDTGWELDLGMGVSRVSGYGLGFGHILLST